MTAFDQAAIVNAQHTLNFMLASSIATTAIGWVWLVRTWREVAHHFR